MAEVAGLCLAVFGIIQPLFSAAVEVYGVQKSASSFGIEAGGIRLRISMARRYTRSFEGLLFDEKKFPWLRSTLFSQLPSDLQQDIYDLLQQLKRTIYDYISLIKSYDLNSSISKTAIELPTGQTAELEESEERLKELQNSNPLRLRLKWAIRDKKRAIRVVGEMEEWVARTRWLLQDILSSATGFQNLENLNVLRQDSDISEAGLKSGVPLRMLLAQRTSLDMSGLLLRGNDIQIASTVDNIKLGKMGDNTVILEDKFFQTDLYGMTDQLTLRRTQQLTALLCSNHDPGLRVLQARGYVDNSTDKYMSMVFNIPSHLDPRPISLLHLYSLRPSFVRPQLAHRFALAHALAESVFLLHSVGWIHKSLRSENILFFPLKDEKESTIDSEPNAQNFPHNSEHIVGHHEVKIVGFEFSRLESDHSTRRQDDVLSRNIYRHPTRWGKPTEDHKKVHDLYALGALLLEIGLWQQLTTLDPKAILTHSNEPTKVHEILLDHARKRLGYTMGSLYRNLVLRLLEGKIGVGDNLSNTDSQANEREFREKTLDELSKSSLAV